MWLTHPQFRSQIRTWWEADQQRGWEGFKFMQKLKTIKGRLKEWSKEVFGHVEKEKYEAEARILDIDVREGREGISEELKKEREELIEKVGVLTLREEIKWRQRSRIMWAAEGDGNTKFFHRIASGFRKRNIITKLEVEERGLIEDEGEIENEVVTFFTKLYTTNKEAGWGVEGLNWCPISEAEAAWLERPFMVEEVRKAVFDCGADKAPGPDGFSLSFFQSCWGEVKGDLMKVMNEFHRSRIINGVTNETYVCLIPKKKDALKVGDFRPISLVTSLYKVISKILASRLRNILDSTIAQPQCAFVMKRQILDAALVANEVVEEVRQLKKSGLVFKIDFEKAYDHVEWSFVDDVMKRKGFGEKWRKWIGGCMESVNFSVMINGKPRGKFFASRGVRQGDPLSPFLFTLVTDVLSRLVERAQRKNLLRGLVCGRENVEVSHLQFADDTVFFLEGKEEQWLCLLEVLKLFCRISGMEINKEKCTLTGINFCTASLERMAGEWGCTVGQWPMIYLGLPLGGNPRAITFWNPVVEKVEKRVQNWKKACLSKGGRLTLIQAVLCSLPSYYMSIFHMPKGVVMKVEKIIRSFLWEGFHDGKRDYMVSWKVAGRSKERGGLGIGDLMGRNDALRAKWLWRFPREPSSLWHKVIKSKYGLHANGWDARMVATRTFRNPWRNISNGYPSFLQCCRFVVGNGDRIRFWKDHWVTEGILMELFPRLYRLSRKQSMPVAAFADAETVPISWDFDFRRALNEPELLEVMGLLELLSAVSLNRERPDCRRWEIESSGQYSCRSYRNFLSHRDNPSDFPPCDQIWKSRAPPKVKIMVWLVALRKINTSDTIQRKRPYFCLSPSWCILCKGSVETVDHLFLHCPYATKLWWKLLNEFQIQWVIPKGCYELLCMNVVIRGKRKKARIVWSCLVHAVIWNLWSERNRRIFNDSLGVNTEELWNRVKFGASLWASVTAEFKDYHYATILKDFRAVLA